MHNLNTESLGIPLAKLIGLAHLQKERLLNQYLAPLGMSSAQFKVLAAIHYYDMNSPVEICNYLSINAGSMTRMVERLVKKMLIDSGQCDGLLILLIIFNSVCHFTSNLEPSYYLSSKTCFLTFDTHFPVDSLGLTNRSNREYELPCSFV